MSKYEVIEAFVDLLDETHHKYSVGDSFPYADTVEVSDKRINDLLGTNNRRRKPLIKAVGEKTEVVEKPKDDVELMNAPVESEVIDEPMAEEVKTTRRGRKSQK